MNIARFLSVDPVRGNPKQPQSWNLYAYALGNPVRYVDPDGRLFRLPDDEKKRSKQMDFLRKALGEAGKHLTAVQQNGKWVLGLVDTTRSQFAKMGAVAHGMAYLMGSANTFSLRLGASWATDRGGGAAFSPLSRTISVNPVNFPTGAGGVSVSAEEAFAHELGHAITEIVPGIATRLGEASTPTSPWWQFQPKLPPSEGISMALENAYRGELGLGPRQYYSKPDDYVDPGSSESIFP